MTSRDPAARRSLVALLSAHTISQTGNVFTLFAIPFYVLAQGGSGVEVGIAAFFATAPVIIGGPLGGVLVDRIGYRTSSIAADLISGGTVLAIPLLAMTVGLPLWALLALVFASGLLDTPGQTARRVLLPSFSARAGVPLERSVGFLDGAERFSRLLGAPIAGLLVAGIGPLPALFVNAAAFAVSAVVTAVLVEGPEPVAPTERAATGAADAGAADAGPDDAASSDAAGADASSTAPMAAGTGRSGYWAELAEGFRFVVREPLLRAIVALVLVTNVFDAAKSSSLLPLYASSELGGAAALGVIVAVMGGGAVLGTILFGLVAHRIPRRITFSICFTIAGGASNLAFASGLPFPWLIAATAVAGLAAGSLNPIIGAVELERVPEGMRARVFGLITAGAWAGIPAGGLLGGVSADMFGLTTSFGVIGVLYVVVTLIPLVAPVFRRMERGSA